MNQEKKEEAKTRIAMMRDLLNRLEKAVDNNSVPEMAHCSDMLAHDGMRLTQMFGSDSCRRAITTVGYPFGKSSKPWWRFW